AFRGAALGLFLQALAVFRRALFLHGPRRRGTRSEGRLSWLYVSAPPADRRARALANLRTSTTECRRLQPNRGGDRGLCTRHGGSHAAREFRFHQAGRALGAASGDTGTGPPRTTVTDPGRFSPVRTQQRHFARCASATILELPAGARRTCSHRTR